MDNRSGLLTTLLVSVLVLTAQGQFKIPNMDVDLKGMGSFYDVGEANNVDNSFLTSIQGGFHIQITQNIAVGGYLARSVSGKINYNYGGSTSGYDLQLQTYGADVRISGGRSSKLRPYLQLSYGKLELVEKHPEGGYNLAHSTSTLGANAGLMLRLGSSFYWNMLEVGGKYMTNEIYWFKSNLMLEIKMGLTYNIRIKSK